MTLKFHLHHPSLKTRIQDHHTHHNKDNHRIVITGSDMGYPKINFQQSIGLSRVIFDSVLLKK